MNKRLLLAGMLIASILFLSACTNTTEGKPNEDTSKELSLKIGLMPAVDAAPMYIAEKEGYFEELGLDVEFVVFNNGQERQSALQTNTIDGSITDLIAVATNVNSGFGLKATSMTQGMFPVLVKSDYEDKKDIKATMMEVSVTNFLIDEWFGEDHNIEKVFINEIPARLEMVKSGDVDMGIFPEPMASMGAVDGLEKKTFEMKDGYSPDVLAFTAKALDEKAKAIELFYEGYNKAIGDIHADETIARDVVIEKLDLNESIKEDIILPAYTKASLPDEKYLENIITWVEEVLKKDMEVSPEDLVERAFVE
ncbi:NitT/TauT family transport system substrate-binding protein [Alkalibaculum bacchi]|uniref:NitT/TauT family transport system substrate-binding protein n=1 Tax=Alkalibaculum bacchi TaxID=645887 RepID=A0A366I8K0_9FIRM|nr:ABC transporter substrate-binding protein [Alkalibaculum bacchi]RBP63808.1 NitT/TauT family transport system substrate-binding protein [Alkalibaculum bacchi]